MSERVDVRILSRWSELGPAESRKLAAPHCPFTDPEFLEALEESGAVAPESGWLPRHVVLDGADGVLAAMPLYAKGHSYGEYLFDWDWARAAQAFGVTYYPKLQSHFPFTPATGPKILVTPDAAYPKAIREACLSAAADLARGNGLSQVQLLFGTHDDLEAAKAQGWLSRYGFQYHYRPDGERDFAGFLQRLKSRKRKTIVRERREVETCGLRIERWSGEKLRAPEVAGFFAECYEDTCDRRGGMRYLNHDFFERIFRTMGDRITLAVALRDQALLSAALFFHKGDAVFGRHWGTREPVPFLHFELCYYQGIELALERGARIFEAGAQGEHKIPRGFLPEEVRAAYAIENPQFRDAIARYLTEEEKNLREVAAALAAESPYAERPGDSAQTEAIRKPK